MTAKPLTPREEAALRFAVSPSQTVRALRWGDASIRLILATLDAARKASPPLDVERLTEATESVLGRGEVSTNDGSMGTDHAARLIAAAYDALDPTPSERTAAEGPVRRYRRPRHTRA